MEIKNLSDFDLDHVVYMNVGPHNHEPLKDIVERKEGEINACGESLWAFSSGIAETVKAMCESNTDSNGYVYAVFIDSGEDTESSGYTMTHFEVNGELKEIPNGITVTASNKSAYALYIKEYFKIEGDNVFFTSRYDNNEPSHYIRGFGFLNKKSDVEKTSSKKKVAYVAKLKAPFIVKVTR